MNMKPNLNIILVLVLLFFMKIVLGIIKVNRSYYCEQTRTYPISAKINFITKNTVQYMFMNVNLPRQMNDDIMMKIKVYYYLNGKGKLFLNIQEKFCKAFKVYLGKLGEDLQRTIGMQPGCPMAQGNYSLKNMKLDFLSMGLTSNLPHGKYQVTLQFLEKDSNKELLCIQSDSDVY